MPKFTFTQNRKPWNNASKRAYALIEEWCSNGVDVDSISSFASMLRYALEAEFPKSETKVQFTIWDYAKDGKRVKCLGLNRPNSTEGSAIVVRYEDDTTETETTV